MVFLGTDNGLAFCERDNDWHIVRRELEGQRIRSVVVHEDLILAGTTNGIFRSEDDGQTWVEASTGLNVRHIRWLAFYPDGPKLAFAGTEPASIFISRDGGQSWNECPEVASLREEHGWFLPYSPEAALLRFVVPVLL